MSYLVGEFSRNLDDKGRLSLPSSVRKALSAKSLVVTVSPDKTCLYAFEPENFGSWVDSLFEGQGGYNASNLTHVNARKVLNARAKSVDLDGSGRIGLNAEQRAAVELEKEVVLVCDNNHFEVWNAKRWDAFRESVDLSALFTN